MMEGVHFGTVPWDIGEPQPVVVELEDAGRFGTDVLDAGCGLGGNAILLARRGHRVTGVDAAPAAIEVARRRARSQGVDVEFAVADVTSLDGYDGRFDSVLDSGLDGDRHAPGEAVGADARRDRAAARDAAYVALQRGADIGRLVARSRHTTLALVAEISSADQQRVRGAAARADPHRGQPSVDDVITE